MKENTTSTKTESSTSNGASAKIPVEEAKLEDQLRLAKSMMAKHLVQNPKFWDGVAIGVALSGVIFGAAYIANKKRTAQKPTEKTEKSTDKTKVS